MNLLTERSQVILMAANMGDKSVYYVPNDAACFDTEQQDIITLAQSAYGITGAANTFKVVEKDGERNIYQPSALSKDGKILIQWGDTFHAVDPTKVMFDGYKAELSPVSDLPFALKVRTAIIKPEDAKTKVTKAYAALARTQRLSFSRNMYFSKPPILYSTTS